MGWGWGIGGVLVAKSNIIIFKKKIQSYGILFNVSKIVSVPGLSVFWVVAYASPLRFLMNHGLEIAG